jgi:hypothetical protein
MDFFVKVIVSAFVIAVVSELAMRYVPIAGSSLPFHSGKLSLLTRSDIHLTERFQDICSRSFSSRV